MSENNLESLYAESQQAFKARDYGRATDLLKQILVIDENYKDSSRLLAQTVKLRRRRWYSHPLLWSAIGVVGLIWTGLLLAPRVQAIYARQIIPTAVDSAITPSPAKTQTPTIATPVTPTPVPLAWKRVNIGQEFPRDTITAIVIDPKDADVIYIGAHASGIYKSIDGGLSWQPILNGLERASVQTLVIDPKDTNVLYAGTSQYGVFKTEDGGQNWKSVYSKPGNGFPRISIVAIDPQDSQHLVYTNGHGVKESRSGGERWNDVFGCPNGLFGLAFHPTDGTVFATQWNDDQSCQKGVYRINLHESSSELIYASDKTPEKITIDMDSNGELFLYINNWEMPFVLSDNGSVRKDIPRCGFFTSNPFGGVVADCNKELSKITDGGQTWENLGNLNIQKFDQFVLNGQNPITVSPHNPKTILLGGRGLFISRDGGNTWEESFGGLPAVHLDLHPIYSEMTGIFMEAMDRSRWEDNVYFSSDGGINWNLIAENGRGLSVNGDGTRLFRYQSEGNPANVILAYEPTQNGLWKQSVISLKSVGQEISQVRVNPFNPNQLFMSNNADQPQPPYIFFSEDSGTSWNPATGIPEGESTFMEMGLFFLPEPNPIVYAMGNWNAEARSEDGGKTWKGCGEPNGMWLGTSEQSRVAVSTDGNETVYLATRGDGVYISNDKCQTWSMRSIGPGGSVVNSVVIDPNNSNTVYAGADGGAYVSFNGGQAWEQINNGLLGATVVYSIVVDKESNVYAATPYGVFKLEKK